MGRRLVLVFAVVLAGCGGEVLVETGDVAPDATPDPSGTGSAPSCNMCGLEECGNCNYEGGDYAYACRDGGRPPTGSDCLETGSVYSDGAGFYECWRCFYD